MKKLIFTFYAFLVFIFSVEASGNLSRREIRKTHANLIELNRLHQRAMKDGVITKKEHRVLALAHRKIRRTAMRDRRDRNRF